MSSIDTYSVQNLKLGGHDTSRWKNVFAVALRKVSSQVNPGFGIQPEALDYVEDLIISLLLNMIEIRPHSLADIEQHVQKTFPEPINEWAVNEAHEVVTRSGRRNRDKPVLPWREVQSILKEILNYKMDSQVVMYLIAVLEYIAADILKLTGNYVKNIRHTEITFQDLKVAMRADSVLMEMFFRDEDETSSTTFNGWVSNMNQQQDDYGNRVKGSLSYEDTVKDLIHDETQYLRDVNMIVLVFRSAFEKVSVDTATNSNRIDLDLIFSNILDVREFTARFLSSLEESVEMTREGAIPEVGNCFSEMAQALEFAVYDKYAEEILMPDCLDHLNSVLNWSHVKENFDHMQAGFRLAAKYVLPKLLLIPIFHCLTYFEYLSTLKNLKSSENDRSDLRDSDSYLFLLKARLDQHYTSLMRRKFSGQFLLRLSGHNQTAIAKIQELTKSVDGWDSRIDGRNCSEFILEGNVGKLNTMQQTKLTNTLLGPSDTLRSNRNRTTERYIYLFDNLIVLCKSSQTRRAAGGGANESKYKLKEFFQIRRIEVIDRDDTDDLKYSFELKPKNNQPSIVLFAKSQEDKQNWMAALVMLQARSMLERKLDAALAEEENRIPLLLPCVEQYKFAEKDLEDVNIKFENYSSSSGMPIVKAATVPKLIERLTHHQQVDPNFTKMFLMTYRSFCEPKELLGLLIERFDIKDPPYFDVNNGLPGVYANGSSADPSSPVDSDLMKRDAMKKFRKKYAQPIQIRVLNVMRHWFDGHWYDFEQDAELLESFKNFLKRIEESKHIKKWVKNFLEIIVRKEEAARNGVEDNKTNMVQIFNSDPPQLEWHLTQNPELFDLMALHPVEIARQVTLLEFDLYRAVKPIELVDAAWTKKDKSRSPQLTKLMKHSTNFNYWLQNCILECGNVDERIAVMNRILEIMTVFDELNNFNGLIEIHGVMQSSPIFRLNHTIEKLDKNLWKKYNEVQNLLDDRRHRKIQFKLKSINPPCVPFFGTYLTDLTYVNEAGKFFTPNVPLTDKVSDAAVTDADGGGVVDGPILGSKQMINVVKCRKTANIISEIQLYQDAPYCLRVEPSIRHFFESLNPLEDFNDNPNDFQTYLYERSLVVEPKNCDRPIYCPPKRELSQLKSPGIRHLKQNMKVKNSVNVPSTPLFTPLQNYGKDKPLHNHSSSHVTSTAPASPTSSRESDLFSIIEIQQGHPPKYLGDVTSSRRGDIFTTSPSGSATLPTRTRTNSNPPSITGSSGPPIPPRHTTLGRTPKQASSSEISPPLPPKTRDTTKSASPRSPLTGLSLNNGGSEFGATFRFPDPPTGPGRPPSKSPPPSLPPLMINRPITGPAPEIPPRKTLKTPLPLMSARQPPPPLVSGSSWSTDSPPPTASSSSQFTPTSSFVRVDGAASLNGTSTTPKLSSSSSPPPPLPPRARLVSPPPRPPKRGSIQPQSAPPLPPKTYKSKSRFDDSENDER